jgi:molybdopterin-biosynthesis enzyme MoeA-like protein
MTSQGPPAHDAHSQVRGSQQGVGAPGFWIGNVIVMAGVPSIMQAMLDEVAPKLKIGIRMLSETMRADAREGDIGMQLGEIAKANPAVAIGS